MILWRISVQRILFFNNKQTICVRIASTIVTRGTWVLQVVGAKPEQDFCIELSSFSIVYRVCTILFSNVSMKNIC